MTEKKWFEGIYCRYGFRCYFVCWKQV